MLIQITGLVKGQSCDLYPPLSIFEAEHDERGLRVSTRNASWIPPEFPVKELPADTKLHACPNCATNYDASYQFIDSWQKGEKPMCLTCYEKRFVIGDAKAYRAHLL